MFLEERKMIGMATQDGNVCVTAGNGLSSWEGRLDVEIQGVVGA